MNINLQLIVKLLIVFVFFSLASCDDSVDVVRNHSEYGESEIGEWYMYQGTNGDLQRRVFFEFERDGSFSICQADVSFDGSVDYGYGKYTLNGKKLKLSYTMYETSITDEYEIRSVGKYDMHLFYPSIQQEEIDYRIIETKYMRVGETASALISDINFIPDSYESDDNRVVKVDQTGIFHALRQGTAYVLIHSSIGTAVVRVVVNADTYVEDFVKYIGENVRMAADAYGPNTYKEGSFKNGLNQRWYFLIDDIISELVFLYNQDDIVEHIMLQLRYPSDVELAKKAFYHHYQYEEEREDVCYFRSEKSAREIRISINEKDGIVQFYFVTGDDPIAEVDSIVKELAVMNVTEVFSKYDIPETDRKEGLVVISVENEVFTYIYIYFDPNKEKIKMISIETKEGVSLDDLDSWYRQHYIFTDSENFKYMNATPRMHILFEEYEGVCSVDYYIS